MILYFADRHLQIIGHASTNLREGARITEDLLTEDAELGISIFEGEINYTAENRLKVKEWTDTGNYILFNSNGEDKLCVITDFEDDTKAQRIRIYAEDDGLDLINEIVGEYEADQYHPISYYVEKYTAGSGWKIGINEVEGLTRKLSFDSEETITARLLKIAEAFNNCEISYSFDISGLQIKNKYINLFAERGKDTGEQLRLNKEIDSIITTKSITNLATALKPTGGTPDDSEEPITLTGYEYDNGDFYIDGDVLKSRKALENWSRFLWNSDESQQSGGHIVKLYSDDSLSQGVLLENSITELKKLREAEINYEADIKELPENVKVGDRVNIIDDKGELYLSSRILTLETSETENSRRAVIGEHLIRNDGISTEIEKLAAEFAKQTVSVKRAESMAKNASALANDAKNQASSALSEANSALQAANNAQTAVSEMSETVTNASNLAQAAQTAVGKVEESVTSLQNTVTNAQQAADNAHQAAQTATQKAEEAKTAADSAKTEAQKATAAVEPAKTAAVNAESKANQAIETANNAKITARESIAIAQAAKADAEQAEKDIQEWAENLETFEETVSASYARKTDLTEAKADLETKLLKNAAGIESSSYKLTTIDETTNNAMSKAEAAQTAANKAQETADEAQAEYEAAQMAADEAQTAADAAQAEYLTAKAAADTAKEAVETAKANLDRAYEDLRTVSGRVDATEAEIITAQTAITTAENALVNAQAEARNAKNQASSALTAAAEAVSNAEKAQLTANAAKERSELAQEIADEAQGNADKATEQAEQAQAAANAAQEIADTAKETADEAQRIADEANLAAETARATLTEKQDALYRAEVYLAYVTEQLADIESNAESTQEEIEQAQAEVDAAQTAVNTAQTAANTAQSAYNTAQAAADTAQTAADEAKADAEAAQTAADEALSMAYIAVGLASALCKRTTEVEAKFRQTADGFNSTVAEVRKEISANGESISVVESLIQQLTENISTLVTGSNGTTLMTQTENGWTFNIGDIKDNLSSFGTELSNSSKVIEELTTLLGSVESAVDAIRQGLESVTSKTAYIDVVARPYINEEGGISYEPCIELGERSNSQKLLITNTQIAFKVDSQTPTWINSDGLTSENVTVRSEIRQQNLTYSNPIQRVSEWVGLSPEEVESTYNYAKSIFEDESKAIEYASNSLANKSGESAEEIKQIFLAAYSSEYWVQSTRANGHWTVRWKGADS